MKIILSANTTWFIYNFRRGLIKELINIGHDVVVVSPTDVYKSQIEQIGARHVDIKINNSGTNPFREAISLLRLIRILYKEQPMLICSNTPKINIYLSLASSFLNIPMIATVCGLGSGFLAGGILKVIILNLYKIAFRYPKKIFFENENDRADFVNLRMVNYERTEYVPGSGVNITYFSNNNLNHTENKIVFLLAARLLWDKGVGEFIEAARIIKKKYSNVEFQLLGFLDVDNPTAVPKAQIEKWISEDILVYLGATDDVRQYFCKADCIVLPSYREGNPKSLLEAASMSIPIITTDVVGCRDTIDDDITGYLCQVKNPQDLAAKMEKMYLLSPEQRRQMGMKGREKMIKFFDEKIVINKYLNAIKSCEQISTKTFIEKIFEYLFSFVFRFKGN